MELMGEQTFLIISFVIAGCVLYKCAYSRLNGYLNKSIKIIGDKIREAREKKSTLDAEKAGLRDEIKSALEEAQKAREALSKKAEEVIALGNEEVSEKIEEKRQEYETAQARYQKGILANIKKKYITIIISRIKEKFSSLKDDTKFQDVAITNSLDMLEEYISNKR